VNWRPLFMGVTPHMSSGERRTRRLSPTFLIDLQTIYKVSSGVSVGSVKKVAGEFSSITVASRRNATRTSPTRMTHKDEGPLLAGSFEPCVEIGEGFIRLLYVGRRLSTVNPADLPLNRNSQNDAAIVAHIGSG
jgi:hypothetical protein